MTSTTVSVGVGQSAPGMEPRAPFQQLGAAPGSSDGVPGYDGFGPEEDGIEFASSGEAADAPRDGQENEDYDTELGPDLLDYIQRADLTAREATIAGYETGVAERESAGEGVGLGREEAVTGSTPAYPGTNPPAMLAQTPGHFGSIPAERAPDPLDEEIAQLERANAALRQRLEQERLWAEQQAKRQRYEALRRENEALQRSVSHSSSVPANQEGRPQGTPTNQANLGGEYQSPQRQLGQGTGSAAEGAVGGNNQHSASQARPRWAWGNSRSVPPVQDGLRMESKHWSNENTGSTDARSVVS